jgi:surface antigen
MMKKVVAILAAAFLLGACANGGKGQKQTGGTLLGAGLGALAGSQIGSGRGQLAAVAIGALAGAFLGNEVGKSLDRADEVAMERSTQTALETAPSGQTVAWRNPDSGNSGTITPQPVVESNAGEFCREYQQTITVAGQSEQAYGTACRQADGSWKIVK